MSAAPHLIPLATEIIVGDSEKIEPSPESMKLLFLARLDDEALRPPPVVTEAGFVLGMLDGDAAVCPNLSAMHRRKLNEAIDEFLGSFWEQPTVQRRERWQALQDEVRDYPRLEHRITELEPLLDVELPQEVEPEHQTGFEIARDVPMLPMSERMGRIVHLLDEAGKKPTSGKRVMRELAQSYRALQPITNFLEPTISRLNKSMKRPRGEEPHQLQTTPVNHQTPLDGLGKGMLTFLLIVIAGIIRIGCNSRTESTQPIQPIPYRAPTIFSPSFGTSFNKNRYEEILKRRGQGQPTNPVKIRE